MRRQGQRPDAPPNPQEQIWQELIDKNSRILKAKNPKHLQGINEMITELFHLSKINSDDSFLRYMLGVLEGG